MILSNAGGLAHRKLLHGVRTIGRKAVPVEFLMLMLNCVIWIEAGDRFAQSAQCALQESAKIDI